MDRGNMPYSANTFSTLVCEQRHIIGRSTLDSTLGAHTDTATLAWLISALGHARTQGQTKLLTYLQIILEDTVFEMESSARG
jgi:hypothetical protein